MGFGGATAAMVASLKNNKRKKERIPFGGLGNSDKESQGIPSKPISEEALAEIRNRIKREERVMKYKIGFISCILILTALLLILPSLK